MAYVNLPPSLYAFFDSINSRLLKLETANRFTAPVIPVLGSAPTITGLATGDPTNPRAGDIWLNSTSNTPKYVDATGSVTTLGGGGGTGVNAGVRPIPNGMYSLVGYDTVGSAVNSLNSGVVTAQPFILATAATATRLRVQVDTGAASSVARLAIYSNNATSDQPDALLLNAGTISAATSGIKTITISQPLTAGLWWLAIRHDSGPNTATYIAAANDAWSSLIGPASLAFAEYAGYSMSGTGSLPANFVQNGGASYIPTIWIGF